MTNFVLDTNVIADMMNPKPNVNVLAHLAANFRHNRYLCAPVDYEVQRGYLKSGAIRKLQIYREQVRPRFPWQPVIDDDWQQAAQLWANAVGQGKQLADIDLLIAAIALRLGATIVTADDDFNALPVKWVNWREPPV